MYPSLNDVQSPKLCYTLNIFGNLVTNNIISSNVYTFLNVYIYKLLPVICHKVLPFMRKPV